MKNLWAPWRMTYILSDKNKEEVGCIFCLGDRRVPDEDRLVLYVGKASFVMMNRFPYNNGHLLVAPIRHVPDIGSLISEERLELMDLLDHSVKILKEVMNPDGFNVGLNLGRVAGAGVEEHLHFHIVPRWNGDTNFMTVFSDIRVIPEHLKETYRRLKVYYEKLSEER